MIIFKSGSQKDIENGIITQMRADWMLPEDKKLEVTLKILKSEKHLTVSFFISRLIANKLTLKILFSI